MPSLNVAEYIKECIESVLNQTLKDIEIICVDAGSTDGTLEILQVYAEKDERLQIVHSERKSYGYQINLGLSLAKGKYIGIVETDDYIKPKMYETLSNLADQNRAQIVKSDFSTFQDIKNKREFTYRKLLNSHRELYNKIVNPQENIYAFWAYGINPPGIYLLSFIRNNCIKLNETPGASYQDNGFWFQMFSLADRVFFLDKAFYMVRRDNPNSSVKSKEKVYCICEEYDFIRNFLKNHQKIEKRLAPICAYFRFGNYCFTLNRIDAQFKKDFIYRFSKDFSEIRDRGELNEELYSEKQWEELNEIIREPDKYYYRKFQLPTQKNAHLSEVSKEKMFSELQTQLKVSESKIRELEEEIHNIHFSWSYKIGRFITWIPRVLRSSIRCLCDNGLRYTWYRFLKRIGIRKQES